MSLENHPLLRFLYGKMTVKKKYVVASLGGFLWRIALYVRHGYTSYAMRQIPEGKDIESVDSKIFLAYNCTYNSNLKKKRRKEGKANVTYLRHEQTILLLATPGVHEEFYKSADVKSIYENPIYYSGYSIGIQQGKPCIKIAPKRFKKISDRLHQIALHDKRKVVGYFQQISPFTFKGVADQRWKLFRQIQKRRRTAGLKCTSKHQIQWEEVNTWRGRTFVSFANHRDVHHRE